MLPPNKTFNMVTYNFNVTVHWGYMAIIVGLLLVSSCCRCCCSDDGSAVLQQDCSQLAKSCFDPTRRFNRPQHQLRAVYSVGGEHIGFQEYLTYQD